VSERKQELDITEDEALRGKPEPEGADAEGHTVRGKFGREEGSWRHGAPDDETKGEEPPKEPGDPDDWLRSDRNVKRDIVPVRW
jgi:hypothetical protein